MRISLTLTLVLALVAVTAFGDEMQQIDGFTLAPGASMSKTVTVDDHGYNVYFAVGPSETNGDLPQSGLKLTVSKMGGETEEDETWPFAINVNACSYDQAGTYTYTVENTGATDTVTGTLQMYVEDAVLVEKNDYKGPIPIAGGIWKYYRMVVTSNKNDTHFKVWGEALTGGSLSGIYVKKDYCPSSYCPLSDDPRKGGACHWDARGDIADGDDPYVESIFTPQGVYWIGIHSAGGNQTYQIRATGAAATVAAQLAVVLFGVIVAVMGMFSA